MGRAAEAFLRSREFRQELARWRSVLVGRKIIKVKTDMRTDDTIALHLTLDDGTEFLGPSVAEYNGDTDRMETL